MAIRISGLASGMDTDTMVKELMTAHRKPLDKIYKQKELANWKIDAYREVNTKLLEYRKSMEDLRLQRPFNSKIATSSNPNAINATATGTPTQSSYEIKNISLAKPESAASVKFFTSGFDTTKTLTELGINADSTTNKVELSVNGQNVSLDPTMKLSDALSAISTQAAVSVSYSATDKSFTFTDNTKGSNSKVIISETTTNGSNFLSTLNMISGEVSSTQNTFGNSSTISSVIGSDKQQASAEINGLLYKSDTNSITYDGMQFDLLGVPQDNTIPITVTAKPDNDKIFENIKTFVDGYNKLIEDLNTLYSEKKSRSYQPLTSDEKEAMTDKEVELWEERAKVGLLGRDPILSKVLTSMRSAMYTPVTGADTGATNPIDTLEEIGIKLSTKWEDNGKLELDENKLKGMISSDLTKVAEVFNKSTSSLAATDDSNTIMSQTKFSESGVADRIYERLEATMKELTKQALGGSQSTIGKQLTSFDTRIAAFESRLVNIENRYYRQFSAMEKAIQRANSQSSWLSQQLG